MNGVDYRRLMRYHDVIKDVIRLIFINMSKGIVSYCDINLITNKQKQLLKLLLFSFS